MNGLEIAIIGMSGRYARSKNLDEFWQHLVNGEELTTVFPNSNSEDKTVKAGSILDDVEMFDAGFFGFNPREAEIMDPQHRMFLECAWEALENAGYNPEIETRPIGVYASVEASSYLLYNLYPNQELFSKVGSLQTTLATDKDYVPSRVSYKLNLKGPSLSVGTSCSSSLVAVHLACQSLLSGECDMALAAGISVKVPQNEVTLSPGAIISTDGHCRAFDAKANGTIAGNGIGVVLLKRLEDAIADKDNIYAVIKGSAINNDGSEKMSYTAPSEEGQARVMRAAHIMAEVEPDTITYMEAHGTGTFVGDPIEVAAMTRAFGLNTDKKGFCAIGSVKTNIGHLVSAAGITSLIKAALALKHKVLPPSLNFETPNPQIDFENSPFFVNTKLSEWNANGIPRRAAVNSAGIGGTNAHVILEEAPPVEVGGISRSHQLLLLSARSESALEKVTQNLVGYLKSPPTPLGKGGVKSPPTPLGKGGDGHNLLADVACTLQVGRKAFPYRRMVVAQDLRDAVTALDANDPQQVLSGFAESANRPLVFMFSGQGSQYAKMGRGLYETEPVFRQECDRCWQLLEPYLKLDWLSLSDEQLQETAIAQPALFVIEYALAKLWMSWGVRPTAAIGHSIGEYVAATLAGVFSLEDALMLVATRGRLMQEMPAGAMLSVNLPASEVTSLLAETGIPDLELAVNNAPSLSAISGTFEAVEKLENLLAAREIFCRRLHTSHGFHSQSMEGAIAPFTEAVKKVELNPPQMPFVSNVTGTWILPEEAIAPIYWARHLRQPVRFSDGMAELLKVPERVFLEVGPGRALATLARRQGGDRVILSSLPHPEDKRSDTELLANTLGQLWLKGVNIDWMNFSAEQHRVPLPTYPFERQRYWIEPTEIKTQVSTTVKTEKKADIGDWFYVPSWKREILPAADFTNQKSWLVFADDSNFCADFCQQLSGDGVEVIRVKAGSQYEQIDRNFYAINPASRADYDSLFKEVCRGDKVVAIAHLWTLKNPASLEESQTLGFYSLLDIARAFGSLNSKNSLEINVISSQVQKVVGSEEIFPEKATLLGACQVIPQEFFKLNCRHIDVELSETQTDERHKLIDRLIIELTAKSPHPIIAYRGGRRWVETFEPIKLEKVSGTKRLREKGVYLITGGMGGIGLAIAEYLASTVRAKLVLIGRSDFPPKSEWEGLLKTWETFLKGKGETNEAIAKIKQLQKLEELGAEVLIVKADVADKQQMQNAVNRVREQFGDIHGVIHAAGVVGKNDIQTKTPEAVEAVFAPKVKGTLVLAEIFKDSRLDFLVFWSSISSIIGGIGQIDYAAANAFIDKFASCQTDGFTMSVNWDIWKEVGMAANVKVPEEYRKRHEENLKQTIATQEGIEAFNRILNGDKLELNSCSQVAVSTIDFQSRVARPGKFSGSDVALAERQKIEQSRNLNASEVQQKFEENGGSQSSHSRPHLGNAFVAPRNELEEKVAKIWEELIGIEKVGVYDNFFELGGHSLLATQVNSRLQEIMPVEVSMQDFLAAPTVAGICEKIEEDKAGGDELNSQTIVAVSREAYRQLTISN